MNETEKLVPRAIFAGIGTFIALYILFVLFATLAGGEAIGMIMLFQFGLFVVSGYVAGRTAGHDGWLNGLVLGIPLPFIVAIGLALVTQQASGFGSAIAGMGLFWLIQSLLFSTLGGFIYDMQRKLFRRSL